MVRKRGSGRRRLGKKRRERRKAQRVFIISAKPEDVSPVTKIEIFESIGTGEQVEVRPERDPDHMDSEPKP